MASENTSEAIVLAEAAKAISITNQPQFDEAKQFLLKIVEAKKKVAEWWDPVVKKSHEAWKEATKHRKMALAPLEEAETFLRPKIALYLERQRIDAMAKNRELAVEAAATGLPILEVSAPKDENITTRTITKYEVFDPMALIRAVAEGSIPAEAAVPNEEFLTKMVRAMGMSLNYPGVRVYKEQQLVVK